MIRIQSVWGVAGALVLTSTVTHSLAAGGCVPQPLNLIAWYQAESNALDSADSNAGFLVNVGFAPAEAGLGFLFNGNSYVGLPTDLFPYPTSGTGNAQFSFEAWFQTTAGGVLLGQQDTTPLGRPGAYVPALYVGTDGKLYAALFWDNFNQIVSPGTVNDGVFHHVAVTFDGTAETLFLDGMPVGAQIPFTQMAYAGTYYYQLGTGFTAGLWPAANNGWFSFSGILDEASVYNRALTDSEVAAIFEAGTNGKCLVNSGPVALDSRLELRFLMNTASADGVHSVRIAKDPRDNSLYYLKLNGDIYHVSLQPGVGDSTSTRFYTALDHGIIGQVEGLAIGPDGTIYVVGNLTTNGGNYTFAQIARGIPGANGTRAWSVLAQTEPYPLSHTAFDHLFNGIIASPDGAWVYVNSGARTDHGEVQSAGGLFPQTREVPLTAKIFRLPTGTTNLLLVNDLNALRSAGYIFAEGTRNAFDFGFAPDGELFAIDNGPDRDMSDELNWLRPGLHYGFPWRMGGADNPQQFPNYDPAQDHLLDPRFIAVALGYYHNDPTFPPPPTNFAEPVINIGPDADKFRDPSSGLIQDASALGQTLMTLTAHRTPLGLVFDTTGALAPPYQHHGFLLSYTPGDPNGTNLPGPFFDPGQDMVDLALTQLGGTNYEARVSRLVSGFNQPVDAEIIGNRIYVLEYGGSQGLWEVTFPSAAAGLVLRVPARLGDGTFRFTVDGAVPGTGYELQVSTNLINWAAITNLVPHSSEFEFVDDPAGSS
ncbi:MAG TPA: LamG-like jellyroll fold domain-containing protein, partial [Verrucomicrobiae bacterium]|nr:LamG-like jellyroll fold domain-containing protein [Verrucomicrobiae bacterium]